MLLDKEILIGIYSSSVSKTINASIDFWTFTSPVGGAISGFIVKTSPSGNISIKWGDGSPNTITGSGSSVSHSW